ncbi:MAG: dimethylarginine dimethylaminohydrolase family protein [Thermodesulfobacteriota bacterium]
MGQRRLVTNSYKSFITKEPSKERVANTASYAEFSIKPEAFLVHDPVAVGAFEVMEGIDDPGVLEENILFHSRPDVRLYVEQHRAFVELLRKHVKKVIYLNELVGDLESFRASKANPNQVFTRDSLITIPWIPNGYIKARMAKPLRRSESDIMEAAVKKLGLREIVRLPEHLFLEGGDVIPFSRNGIRTLLVGYGRRTRLETLYFLQEVLIPQYVDEIIGIELAEWRINLDGGLLPIAEDVTVADMSSIVGGILFDDQNQEKLDIFEMLRDLGMRIIDVTPDESLYCQACNCVCLGERRVIYYDLADRVHEILLRHEIEVYRTSGSELVKGRGSPPLHDPPNLPEAIGMFEKKEEKWWSSHESLIISLFTIINS